MPKYLSEFMEELNERNVEITKPSDADRWGLRIEMPDGKTLTFKDLEQPWQAAVKEVISYIRKNLNYTDFQADTRPVDLQFKADGSVLITSDKGQMILNGKPVKSVNYKLVNKVKV